MAKNIQATVDMLPEFLGQTEGLDAGQKAILGALLVEMGKQLTEEAKGSVATIFEGGNARQYLISGVMFTRRAAYTQTRVDNAYIKENFPKSVHPEFWKEVSYKESIRISLPKE